MNAAERIEDFSRTAHDARQRREIDREALAARARNLRPAGRFRHERGQWQPQPYPGFALLSLLSATGRNEGVAQALRAAQRKLVGALPPDTDLLCALPPDSFHQTVANLASAERLQDLARRGADEATLPGLVAEALESHAPPAMDEEPPVMRLIGLAFFRSAIGALGVFDSAGSYRRILAFRNAVYQSAPMALLDLVRSRPFVGHVTLAYIERKPSGWEACRLLATVEAINEAFAKTEPLVAMPEARLCQYQDLSRFWTRPEWPGRRL